MYLWWRAGSDGRWRRETVRGDRGNLLQAASGERHSLLLLSGGSVHACGDNSRGQLGQKRLQSKEQPALIQALESLCFDSVSCGKEHSLALCHKGRVFAWGAGSEGQLGIELKTEEYEGITFIPTKIKTFNDIKIIQVSCGDYHSLALSEGGQVFSWGMNKYGQLGLGEKSSSQTLPQQVKSLLGIPVAQVAAGGTHSFVLSLSGTSFGWGRNNKGQLALSGNEIPGQINKPRSIGALKSFCVVSISCGHEHTAVLTQEGKVFTFGDNSFGQLGYSPTAAKTGPQPVKGIDGLVSQIDCGSNHTLAYVYTTGQVVSFGRGPSHTSNPTHPNVPTENSDISCLISSKDLMGAKVKRIFAGTYANFVSTHQECSTDVSKKILPEIKQINQSLTEKWIGKRKSAERKEAESEIRTIFSSAACLTASFLKKRVSGEVISIDVDLEMARDTFQKLTKEKWISSKIATSLSETLLGNLPCRSPHKEALSVFLLLPECPVMHDPDNWSLVVPFANAVCKMTRTSFKVLEQCWASLQDSFLNTLVQMLKTAIVSQLKHWTISKQPHHNIKDLMEVMKRVYKVNNNTKCRLSENTFHINELSDIWDFFQDRRNLFIRDHMESEENFLPIIFYDFPFVFNLQSKIKLLEADSKFRMLESQQRNFNLMASESELASQAQCFLKVKRSCLVKDALRQLNQVESTDLCKELTVHDISFKLREKRWQCGGILGILIVFADEIDYSGEGVKSEFFHCIFEEMTNSEYGMFIYPEEGSYMWFPINAEFPKENYYLFGILCGLSLFHLIVVNIPFPLALYKKLLGLNPSLEDLKELSPTWGNLQEILNYDADDLGEQIQMNFSIHWDQNKVDLIPGGHSILVDQTNKNDYISKCVDYIFNTSVKTIYEEFQRGFYKVCSKRILRFFQPEELMIIMVGNTDFDWQLFEKNSTYSDGYHKSHHTIQMFWKAFHQLTVEEKRKFVFFLTGSDRLHVKRMKEIRIHFCCPETLSEEDYPKSVTCRNILLFPKYSTMIKVKEALQVTINSNKGFTSHLGIH